MSSPLRRSLGRFEVTCLGINAIVGAGIFALPDDLFRDMGGRSPWVFVICALGMWPVAWCYAEAAGRTERSGGPYIYVGEAFGKLPGYVVGWMCFVNSIFSFAAVARLAAAYLAEAVPSVELGEWGVRGVALAVIVTFCGLNALGAKPGARVAAAFTIGKIAALLVLVVVAVPTIHLDRLAAPAPHGWGGLSSAVFVALFAVQGFEVTPVPAGETKDAPAVMPFAILASLVGASLLYVVVQAVMVGSYAGLGRVSDTPLADAAMAIAPRIGTIVVWGGIVSMLGFVAGNAFGTPRYAFAMAEDGYLPAFVTRLGRKHGAPIGAIWTTAVCSAGLALAFPSRALVGISNLAVAVQYLGTCLAIAHGARTAKTHVRRRWFYAITGAIVSLWVLTQGTATERWTAVGAVGVGLLVGLVMRARRPRVA